MTKVKEKPALKDFRFTITAGPKVNPDDVRKKLVELLEVEADTFENVSDEFISSVENVTVVPVEIALTMPERDILMSKDPTVRFIVTGVTNKNADSLTSSYGYVHYEVPVVEEKKDDVKLIINGKEYEVKDEDVEALKDVVENIFRCNLSKFLENYINF